MSVRETQGLNRSAYSPQGGSHLALHRAVVASSSLLAISAAMGWASPALAAGTCGAPVGHVANCNATSYGTGIEYTGANAVDDLTVNVGTFAGQNGAVTVSSPGIVVDSNVLSTHNTSESVNVGANVAITSAAYNGITVVSTSSHKKASDAIVNQGSVTAAANGIVGEALAFDASGSATASGSILSTGDVSAAGGDGLVGVVEALGYSTTADVMASTASSVTNAGGVTSLYTGVYSAAITEAISLGGSTDGVSTSSATNAGSVATTGNYAAGVAAASTGIAETLPGAHAYSTVSVTAANAGGVIVTSGHGASGVDAVGLGEAVALSGLAESVVTVTGYNSGSVTTTGTTGYATIGSIKYYAAAAKGVASYSTSMAYGAMGAAAGAYATAENTGTVSTAGTFAHGVVAGSTAEADTTPNYGALAIASSAAVNTGSVTTSGAGAIGVDATATAYSGVNIVGSTVFPNGAYYGTSVASATAENVGAITTSGSLSYTASGGTKTYYAAYGMQAKSYSVAGGFGGSRGTATSYALNAGTITTSGLGATGINVQAMGVGLSYFGVGIGAAYASAVNAGSIATSGTVAAGMYVGTTAVGYSGNKGYAYSEAKATNVGTIATTGTAAAGILVEARALTNAVYANSYASANVVNAGSISTTGDGAVGIYSLAGDVANGLLSAPYANSTVVNAGSITTKGIGAAGIVSIASTYAGGVFVYSAAHSSITNAGSVVTSGTGAAGLYAYAVSNAASGPTTAGDNNGKTYAGATVVNAGLVSTSGDGAVGMAGVAHAGAYSRYYSHAVTVSNMINVGAISTSGAGAHGIVAQSTSIAYTPATNPYASIASATSTVLSAGPVTTTGAGANGILAVSFAYALGSAAGATATATTKVTNAGAVTSAGGDGIYAVAVSAATSASNGTATSSTLVINAGSVMATGAGASGVFAAALASNASGALPASATVVNASNATITASGAGGIGVKAEGAYSTVVTYAGSSIQGGTGAGAAGVYENGALNIISNAGAIGSGNDHAVNMYGLAANIISNTGTITGYVTMHATGPAEQNVFYNYGTWVARGGNSDFTHSAGGGSNLVNEGGGTIVVVGNQSFLGLDKFTNFGSLVTMTQAASAGLGSRPAFETLTVSGDYEGIGGSLAVDVSTVGGMNGDELVIQGAASGGTGVKVSILGAPGLTTGNGILLVKAGGSTGASNFTLDGNANSGHSQVDGAFEYNLAFVPGAGTSGEWFLQSEVYPGVSQFGQIGSSTALISDSVNPSVEDLLNQVMGNPAKMGMLDQQQQVASVDDSFVPSPNGPGVSGFGRFYESRFNVDPSGSPFANYKLRVDSVQAGIDYNWHDAANVVMLGTYITPFHAWSDFQLLGGHITSSGTAYGVYGLWFSGPWQAGLRLDTTNTSAHFTDTFIGTDATTHPNEKGAQGMVSYDMPLDWADFTPEAEFNYSTISGVQFTDGVGDLVKVGSTNDVWGKLNGRFSWDVVTEKGLLVQPYVNIGMLYRGDTSTRVTVGAFSSATNINGWDGDFAVGVNTNLAAGLSLSAQAEYLAGNRVEGWQGFIGLRYTPEDVAAPAPAPAAPPPPPPPPPPPVTKTFIVFFDFNKSNLTAEAESVVSEAVKAAKEHGMVRVLVTGHTDTVGSDSYNMGLSVRRAQSVKDEMVRQGMDGSGISIEGKGFHDPLVPTGPGVREPQNRRAVIDLGG